jgi:PAS domain S-box-containing protein
MSEPAFRVLFHSAPGLHLALLPDAPRYTVAAVSDAYLQATLTRREDLVGRSLFEIFPALARTGGAGRLMASLQHVAETGVCDAMPVRRHDLNHPAESGGGVDERWWITINSPAFGHDGKLAYLIHSVEDVTNLVRLRQQDLRHEAAAPDRGASLLADDLLQGESSATGVAGTLLARDESWREVFEQTSDGILICDRPCNRIVDANLAAGVLLGQSREHLTGQRPHDELGQGRPGVLMMLRDQLGAGEPTAREWTVLRGDGTQARLAVTARRLSDGRCLALLRDAAPRQHERAAQGIAADLERRVEQRTQQLRRLVRELEMAESRERRRISRDLHDDLGQLLAAAGIRLAGLCQHPRDDVRRAALEIAELVEQANFSTRSLAAQLEPAVLYELGLLPALEWLAEELGLRYGLDVNLHDDGQPKPLPQEARSIVYRTVRELLINVAKHAGVKQATVNLQREGRWLSVRVGDAGAGFAVDPAGVTATAGMGLVSVRERLSYMGGSFEIRSGLGDGTEAVLRLPLEPDQD